MSDTFETIYVKTDSVACDGDNGSGHPRIYLDLSKTGQVVCPYCSRTFEKITD